ncbi:MAG: hypothetical protein ACOCYB_10020 [Alkalispirochaeta sp.]
MGRTPRIKKRYTKPLAPRKFRKQIVRRIHLDRDRLFAESVFQERPDGTYQLNGDISSDDRLRLARILKEIRKNRGMLKMGRLAVVALIIGGAALFAILFKDRLLEEAAEGFLTTTFEAQSDIEGLQFRPLRGRVSLASVMITDADDPARNLFELGFTEFALNTGELLKGNVVIEELVAADIAFGTERDTPGELFPAEPADAEAADAGPSALDEAGIRAQRAADETFGGLGTDIDPEEILADIYNDLESRREIEALTQEALETREFWETRLGATSDQVAGIRRRAEEISTVDPREVRSVEAIRTLYTDATTTVEEVEALYDTVEQSYARLQADIAGVQGAGDRVRTAVAADMQTLRARIPSFDVDPRDFALATVETFVRSFLGTTYDRGMLVLEKVQSVQRARADRADASPGLGRGGVDIMFPSAEYPRFYVQQATASGTDGSVPVEVRLDAIASHPDRIDRPTRLTFRRGAFDLETTVDMRSSAEDRARYTVTAGDITPPLPPDARGLGFTDLGGTAAVQGSGSMSRNRVLSGALGITVEDMAVTTGGGASRTAQIVADVLNADRRVTADLGYEITEGRITEFSGETSLVDALRARVSQLVAEVRTQVEARLQEELDALVEAQLGPYRDQIAELEALSDRSLEELLRAETYRDTVREQQDAIETRLTSLRDELEAELRAEAERRAAEIEAQARAEAERRAAEAEAQAREEAERRADDARDRIEDEARDRIRVPSF